LWSIDADGTSELVSLPVHRIHEHIFADCQLADPSTEMILGLCPREPPRWLCERMPHAAAVHTWSAGTMNTDERGGVRRQTATRRNQKS
jgi:hypothetical protein